MTLPRSRIVSVILLVLMTSLASRASRAEQADASARAPEQAGCERQELGGRAMRLTLRPAMLADNIDELAGRDVTILNARVVGVFEPHAFLIEPATRMPESVGHRDRVLILLEGAALRVSAESIVASPVRIVGVARTLLGMKISADAPWPPQLDRELIERLDVRASVLATSVQTPEGIELTERRSGAASRRDRSR